MPLSGVRVLDLSRILAGPVCTQILADLGADVVKVERPVTGDDTRHWGPPFLPNGASAYFLSCNRGKRSIAVDLHHPQAQGLLDELIRQADVLVENFLPNDVEKFGLAPQRLRDLNPRLVACSISGYGRTGPLADTPGYDLMVQAMSGLMSITGEPDGAPMKVGVALSDVLAGLYTAISALAGLNARNRTGAGEWFDLALFDCTLASLVNVAQSALVTGERPRRYGNAHPQIVPYEMFATSDGHLMVGIGNDAQYRRLCQALGRPELASDPRFATNPLRVSHRDELLPELRAIFAVQISAHWQRVLSKADLPHSPVYSVDEALKLPQTRARQMVVDANDDEGQHYSLVASPIHWPGRSATSERLPPAIGQHTADVLRDWLGKNDEAIALLVEDGVVA